MTTTTPALLAQPAANLQALPTEPVTKLPAFAEAEKYLAKVEPRLAKLDIQDDTTEAKVNEASVTVRNCIDKLEAARLEYIEPYSEVVNGANREVKKIRDKLKAALDTMVKCLGAYDRVKQTRAAEAAEAARIENERVAADLEAKIKAKTAGVSYGSDDATMWITFEKEPPPAFADRLAAAGYLRPDPAVLKFVAKNTPAAEKFAERLALREERAKEKLQAAAPAPVAPVVAAPAKTTELASGGKRTMVDTPVWEIVDIHQVANHLLKKELVHNAVVNEMRSKFTPAEIAAGTVKTDIPGLRCWYERRASFKG